MKKQKYVVIVKYTQKDEPQAKLIVLQSWREFQKFKSQITGIYNAARFVINVAQDAECECGLGDKKDNLVNELLETCIFAKNKLERLTTDEFFRGGDKEIRNKLNEVIEKAKE